jgi:hypothetical protein
MSITHGDMNGSNIFVSETGSTWLMDFYRTGWGPALRDAAELECFVKFELISQVDLAALFAFERAMTAPSVFSDALSLPECVSTEEFQRALVAIQAIREAAGRMAEADNMAEYYAMLLFYTLKTMTLKQPWMVNDQRQPIRLRHALYSAGLLSAKFS